MEDLLHRSTIGGVEDRGATDRMNLFWYFEDDGAVLTGNVLESAYDWDGDIDRISRRQDCRWRKDDSIAASYTRPIADRNEVGILR